MRYAGECDLNSCSCHGCFDLVSSDVNCSDLVHTNPYSSQPACWDCPALTQLAMANPALSQPSLAHSALAHFSGWPALTGLVPVLVLLSLLWVLAQCVSVHRYLVSSSLVAVHMLLLIFLRGPPSAFAVYRFFKVTGIVGKAIRLIWFVMLIDLFQFLQRMFKLKLWCIAFTLLL